MNPQLYIDIAKHLRAKVPAMKHIDLYNRQYENSLQQHPLNVPAVFVEFISFAPMGGAQGVVEGTRAIRLHCVVTTFKDTMNIDLVNTTEQNKRLAHLAFHQAVQDALEGHTLPTCGAMQLVSEINDHNHNQISVNILQFECNHTVNNYWYKDYINHVITDINVVGEIVEAGQLGQ
jgi:phage gp37-like protein